MALAAALFGGACASSTTSSSDESTSTGAIDESSTGSSPADESSSSSSSGGPDVEQCGDVLIADTTFEVDPQGVTTQIQASLVFDALEQGIWVVYNLPSDDGSGLFDVFVVRLGCDGEPQVPPQRINQTSGRNDVDGELVRVGDDLVVVWASDDSSGGPNNLDVFLQGLGSDGTPRFADDVTLETDFEGAPVPGSAWMPRIAADEQGGFAVIGSRAIEEASAFQVFLQRVDAQGELVGTAFAPPLAIGRSQTLPALVYTTGGEALVAWQASEDLDLDQLEFARGDLTPTRLETEDSSGAALALDPTGEGGYLAYSIASGAGRQIKLGRAEVDSSTTPVMLGSAADFNHTPALASGPGGGAIAWYTNIAGLDNELHVARITDDGAALAVTGDVTVVNAVAAPYPTTITHLVDNVYAVAWSEGQSPDFRLHTRFVDL